LDLVIWEKEMPIKTWLIWLVVSTLWFLFAVDTDLGLSLIGGIAFTILAEINCHIWDKLGRT
jgi:hypothetical protein